MRLRRDGRNDLVVFRPPTGEWFVRTSTSGYSLAASQQYQWGLTGDVPLEDEEFASVSEGAGLATALSLGAVLAILFAGLRTPRIVFSVLVTLLV